MGQVDSPRDAISLIVRGEDLTFDATMMAISVAIDTSCGEMGNNSDRPANFNCATS